MGPRRGHGRRPDLSRQELRSVRCAVAREVFGPFRTQLAAERTAARDTLVAAGRHNLAQMCLLTLQVRGRRPYAAISRPPSATTPCGSWQTLDRPAPHPALAGLERSTRDIPVQRPAAGRRPAWGKARDDVRDRISPRPS